MKYCTSCGGRVKEDAKYCSSCGTTLPQATSVPPSAPSQISESNPHHPPHQAQPVLERADHGLSVRFWVILAAAIVVLIAAGGTTGYLLIRGSNQGFSDNSADNEVVVSSTSTTLSSEDPPADSQHLTTPSTLEDTTSVSSQATADEYVQALKSLEDLLVADDIRLAKPNLADDINATLPEVPRSIDTELQDMLLDLDDATRELSAYDPPADYASADTEIRRACSYMKARIKATLQGINIARSTGTATAGNVYFDEGRRNRDEYKSALSNYQEALPIQQ
ncbi:MAG: hypothetical protein ACOX8V_06925 [Thermoleophilia bacterium]|jgi:hypothetical protein